MPRLSSPLMQRWLWFVGLWAGGVASVMSVATLLRWVLLGRI